MASVEGKEIKLKYKNKQQGAKIMSNKIEGINFRG